MKKFICGVLAVIGLTMPVYAAELSAEYDPVLKKYVVSGSMPEAQYNQLISVKVVSDKDAAVGWVGTLRADNNGSFSESFVFAPTAEGGDYTVSAGIYEQGVVKTTPLFYVSEEQKETALTAVNGAIAKINAAKTEDELKAAYTELDTAIKNNTVYFGINAELYNSLGDAKQDVFEVLADGEYTELEDFVIALEVPMAYALIENADEESITEIMDEYFSYFELEKSELYGKFLEFDKTIVYEKMAGAECKDKADVKAAFEAAVALTLINNTSKWNDFETALDSYIKYTGIDTEYYDKCDKSALASAICDTDFDSSQQLYDAIKSYCSGGKKKPTVNGVGGGKTTGLTVSGVKGEQSYTPIQGETVQETSLYSDMSGFDWADTAVTVLTQRGLINGDGTGRFNPSEFVTREEFVKILLPAFGLYNEGSDSSFSDVDKNSWAYPYISCAYELGIVKGMEDNSFGFGARITRQDMAVLIERAAELAGVEFEPKIEAKLSDFDTVSDYAKDSVFKMAETGIITGYDDGAFRPMNEATRAEAAVMVYRLLSL